MASTLLSPFVNMVWITKRLDWHTRVSLVDLKLTVTTISRASADASELTFTEVKEKSVIGSTEELDMCFRGKFGLNLPKDQVALMYNKLASAAK